MVPPDDDDDGSRRTVIRSGANAAVPGALEPTTVRALTSDRDPLIGAMLGEYRVLSLVGSGGMGLVYRGEHPLIGRQVAIKVLQRELAQDPAHARRFLEEARSVSAARHPGIVDVFGFGETVAGEPYLVMEFLEGEGLDVLLRRRGALPAAEALALLIPMANALGAAHAAGVIHRDLKPGNVFLARQSDGTIAPKLVDFGLARRGAAAGAWVRQTSVGGTPLYVAPEQARGEAVGPQTDLYSLGCMAYELLTGRPPFTSGNLHALLDQHQTWAPSPLRGLAPTVPVELERLVLELLEKDSALRPPSALAVKARLEKLAAAAAVASEPTHVGPAPVARAAARTEELPAPIESPRATPPRATPPRSAAADTLEHRPARKPGPWLLAAGAVLVVGTAALALWGATRPFPPTERAPLERPPEAPPSAALAPVERRPVEPPPVARPPTPPPVERAAVERPPVLRTPVPRPPVARPPVAPPVERPPADDPEAGGESTTAQKPAPITARRVQKKWQRLSDRTQNLPDNLRRAAQLQLAAAHDCAAPPEQCWADLLDIEYTYFKKAPR